MERIKLYHGTDHIIEIPQYGAGNIYNDYGRGFYCTENTEMAKEWACKQNHDGFVNIYELDVTGLTTLNLMQDNHNVLNWIALLLQNRTFRLNNPIAANARDYIIKNFSPDTSGCDIITGYRADDSYFSFAQSFVENSLSLRSLNSALYLGKLGLQTVLISQKAFNKVHFLDATPVKCTTYYPKFLSRDLNARKAYQQLATTPAKYYDDIFIMDILREEMKGNDPRIQRNLSE